MLRNRLFLNLMPFVVILLATGIYAIVLFYRLAEQLDRNVSGRYRSVVAVQQMILTLTGINRETWADLWPGNPPNRRVASDYRKRFEQHLALQLKSTSIPGERELNEQLATNYKILCAEADSLKEISETAARLRVYEEQINPNLLSINSLLDQILVLNQKAILIASTQAQRITQKVTRLMVLGMIVSLAIFVHAFYQLNRSVLTPIQRLTEATRNLGEGTLDPIVPVVSRDELGELALAFNKMAAQLQVYRQSTTEQIVRLHRSMEITLGSFPDPIFVLNQQGGIELRNPAAEALSRNLDPPSRLPSRLQTLIQNVLQSGEDFLPHSFDAVISHRVEGTEKFFLPRILTMRSKENSLFGVAVVLYDVTRFRLLDSAKTHLVGTVSHELKTPLTSVRMVIHILLEKSVGPLAAKQEELLITARNDTERLLGILDNLLDLARLEEGDAELHRENVAPSDLLRTVAEETADQVSARGLKLRCALDADLPQVSVDRTRISHVFTNLVTNAIKHSPPDGEITLHAEKSEDDNVLFTVADQGSGVPVEYQTRIFDRFFRVPGQKRTGAGLGLSIAREITVAHGGRIGVNSSPGNGSTFYVTLKAVDGAK